MGNANIIASNKRRAKHRMCQTPAYQSWAQMRLRCKPDGHKDYGQRGIRVCARWEEFIIFHADMGDPPKGYTLDRINVDGDYGPSNCRWATRKEQANNRRTNNIVTWGGKTQSVADWARELDFPYHVLKHRYSIGWKPPKLFSKESFKGKTTKENFK